ncbi:hypothetical protein MVEN_01965300 [Mycena venus]|uniref:F-box domain-containing protein n=1 Tax=Mycena venus TaxID=2733690 RepID=A0A8H7CLG6_9AGAR|nr:hypothetical protein MVEN_01965300 [Mycena venus]
MDYANETLLLKRSAPQETLKESGSCSTFDLPYELTSKIFRSCLPSRRRVRPHRNRAPLQLAQVCARWRAVALATPQLWTSVFLKFCDRDAYDGMPMLFGAPDAQSTKDNTAAILDLWLTRAAGHPLSISLICSRHTSLPPNLLTTMAKYSAWWGRLELAIPMADFLEFNESAGPFPSLRSLSLQITDHHRPRWNVDPNLHVNTFHNSPSLRTLQLLDRYDIVLSPEKLLTLPRNLTALQISRCQPGTYTSTVDLVQVFAHFPDLLHFGTSSSWPRTIVLPKQTPPLRSLISHGLVVGLFEISSLEHLQFSLGADISCTRLMTFVARSGCHLTSLALQLFHVSNEALGPCLAAVPSLTRLELLLAVAGEGASSAARCELLHQADLLPRLHTLIITDTARRPLYASFVTLLRARPTLARAEMYMWSPHAEVRARMPPPSPSILEHFAALADGGLNVRVTTSTFAWPLHAEDDEPFDDFDDDIFGSHLMRPQSFSPF